MDLAKNKSTYQLADFKNEGELVQPTIRKNFKDTAFWQPDVVTGADGKATVKVRLARQPDHLAGDRARRNCRHQSWAPRNTKWSRAKT